MEGFLNLAWVLPIPPFLAFLAIILFLNRNKTVSALTAIGGVFISFIIGWPIAFAVFTTEHFGEHPLYGELFTIPTGMTSLMIGYQVDPANALMIFMVTFLLLMIFIYSYGYMSSYPAHLRPEEYPQAHQQHKDPRYSRFMAYISLFATGMLGLVVSNSLLTFFVFWEIMGLCSYLLIGFWYEKPSAKKAAFKAFITTRVGDVIMLVGMMLLYMWSTPSTLVFEQVLAMENLEHLAEMTVTIPLIGVTTSAIGLIAVLIFFGTIGKSAQFPLHVWLPDAMEGPTPVSALIHAATMVSAGVYLIIRMYPLMIAGSTASLNFIAVIGAFTALFAAIIAVSQTDIKRVLAFSTISQLGYMFAALGVGAYVAAVFHLITHAFFKALLFLGSGSVIHGMEHGEHHVHEHGHHEVQGFDANDMRYMGGLRKKMRGTYIAFLIGGLALSGFPIITAGFWSKDEILAETWHKLFDVPGQGAIEAFAFLALVCAAFLTAFYTWRQISMTFLGKPRTESAESASESSKSMVVPLLILAVFAILLGFVGVHEDFPVIGPLLGNPLHHLLGEFAHTLEIDTETIPFNPIPVLISIIVALGGLGLSWLVYTRSGKGWQTYDQLDPVEAGMRKIGLGGLYNAMRRKFYFDELYKATVVRFALWFSQATAWFDRTIIDGVVNGVGRFGRWVADVSARFDKSVIDGLVNGVGSLAMKAGGVLRLVQTGQGQTYLLVALLTVLLLLALFAVQIIGIGIAG